MNIDEELGAAMRALESDSPDTAAISATIRQRIAKRNRIRRTAVAGSIAATVVLIATTAPLLIAPNHTGVQTGSAPATPLPSYGAPSGPGIPSTDAPQPTDHSPDQTAPPTISDPGVSPMSAVATVPGSSVRCYATAELRTDNYVSLTLGNGPEPAGPMALEYCRQLWVSGTLSQTEPLKRDPSDASGNPAVPGLVACVLPAQMSDENAPEVAVFPGTGSTCAELNLPVYIG